MNTQNFNTLVNNRCELIKKVLSKKQKEYASDTDRLHNFKRAASMLDISPAQALIGMWAKHAVSILDMVSNDAKRIPPTEELIDEKIGDAINYLILLEAILKERIEKNV